jgi:hypothetical protein
VSYTSAATPKPPATRALSTGRRLSPAAAFLLLASIRSNTPLLGRLALFVLAAWGVLSVLVFQHREPKDIMMVGVASLFAGVAIAVMSLPYSAIVLFFLGNAIAGVGFGPTCNDGYTSRRAAWCDPS